VNAARVSQGAKPNIPRTGGTPGAGVVGINDLDAQIFGTHTGHRNA
jgi:hypothetical protein